MLQPVGVVGAPHTSPFPVLLRRYLVVSNTTHAAVGSVPQRAINWVVYLRVLDLTEVRRRLWILENVDTSCMSLVQAVDQLSLTQVKFT
jgi:hypothetical protein